MSRHRRAGAALAAVTVLACLLLAAWLPGGPALPAGTLVRFLLAVAAVLLVCHLCGALLAGMGQPRVIGEIAGGLLLGPSVLGLWWAGGRDWLFTAEVVGALHLAAELGLVVFMFLLGCELRSGHLRRRAGGVAVVVAGAMGVPLLAGVALAWLGRDLIAGPAHPPAAHVLFFGLAMSITAVPVLARILGDLRRDNTPLGTFALGCAATGDGLTWAALTVLFAAVGVGAAGGPAVVALAVALLLVTVAFVRPALARLVRWSQARAAVPLLPILVVGALLYAAVAPLAGLHPVIGAFLFGLVVPRGSAVVEHANAQLRGFAVLVLLPLFFAGVGMNTAIGALSGAAGAWLLLAAVLVVAVVAKLGGTAVAARAAGFDRREAWQLGALMNCRGVTELVVIAVGFEYQLINEVGLTVLVLMALVTTALTGPLVRLFERGSIQDEGRHGAGPAGDGLAGAVHIRQGSGAVGG